MKPFKAFRSNINELNHFTEAAKERLFTGPGKSDPKRLIGVYTKSGKWIKDMKSEREASKYVAGTHESVQEAAEKPWWKIVKSPASFPKNWTLIQWGNRYFCFTTEPKSQGQGGSLPNWTKAAIWKCDKNGKRTHPTEDPVWDSKSDGWTAEEAMDNWLDQFADPYDALDEGVQEAKGIPNPNTVPGQNPKPVQGDHRIAPKPMTMAQRHTEIQRSGKGIVKFMRTIVADWKSGNMALSRMESVMFNLAWLRGATLGYDPASDRDYKAVAAAFRKKHPEADRILRLGKGSGFNPAMGKVTPNEITRTFEAILAFIETDIPAMKKAGTISAAWDPMGTPLATESVMEITNPAYVPGQNPRPSQDDPRVATPLARLDDRYYYGLYTNGKLREITGPYKSEQSAWDDHGGDMDEILRGDVLKQQMQRGKYKGYTIRLYNKIV